MEQLDSTTHDSQTVVSYWVCDVNAYCLGKGQNVGHLSRFLLGHGILEEPEKFWWAVWLLMSLRGSLMSYDI